MIQPLPYRLPGHRFNRGQNNYAASLIPLPSPRHFLTIISHGIRVAPQNIVLRWIVRCGRDIITVAFNSRSINGTIFTRITRIACSVMETRGLPGIALSKVKFPFGDWDAKIIRDPFRRDEEATTCSTRVLGVRTRRGLHPIARARVTDYKRRVIRAETEGWSEICQSRHIMSRKYDVSGGGREGGENFALFQPCV